MSKIGDVFSEDRLGPALEAADEAYWAVIAAAYPEIKTGDVDPGSVIRRDRKNRSDVVNWLRDNHPDANVDLGDENQWAELDHAAYAATRAPFR